MKELIEDLEETLSEAHVCWGHACANVFEHMGAFKKPTREAQKQLREHLATPKHGLMQNVNGHNIKYVDQFSHEKQMAIHLKSHQGESFASLGRLHDHSPQEIMSYHKMGSGIQKHMSSEHGAGFMPNFSATVKYHSQLHSGAAASPPHGQVSGGLNPKKVTTNANRILYRAKKYSRGR